MDLSKAMHGWPATVVVFVVMICVLVAAHEYGHYLFARIFNMSVAEFAIGFGPKVWTWRKIKYRVQLTEEQRQAGISDEVETEFNLRAIPLGGFVRVQGMQPSEDRSEFAVPGGFYSRHPMQRFIMLLAGPLFSVLAGIVLIFAALEIWGQFVPDPSAPVVVASVTDGFPAKAAGLQTDDRVETINGKPVPTFVDLQQAVKAAGLHPLTLGYVRGGRHLRVVLTPIWVSGENAGPKLGLQSLSGHVEAVSVGQAAQISFSIPGRLLEALVSMITVHHEQIAGSLGGPVRIVSETNEAVQSGPASTVELAAMLSISVGFFNLLPLSILDGGQMLLCLWELLRGKPLSYKFQMAFLSYGFILLLTMVFGIMYLDVKRLLPQPASSPPVAAPAPNK
jgi:regulator of sigma E protease